jgi:hypothetical protein
MVIHSYRQVRTIQSLEGRFIPAIALTGWFSEEEQPKLLMLGFSCLSLSRLASMI